MCACINCCIHAHVLYIQSLRQGKARQLRLKTILFQELSQAGLEPATCTCTSPAWGSSFFSEKIELFSGVVALSLGLIVFTCTAMNISLSVAPPLMERS